MAEYRIEKDALGEIQVPVDALYGAQTQRACENFPISGIVFPRAFIKSLGLIKSAAAETNGRLGLLESTLAGAIRQAGDEVAVGKWDNHFPVDIFQTGSGTSTNMNANEVIARRASQILREKKIKVSVHPNDHVNLCQSSNDVIPTAIHVTVCMQLTDIFLPALIHLVELLRKREADFRSLVKTGRTHLMDAVPILFGQEIGAWAFQIEQSIDRIKSCFPRLAKLALGGTAVGSGINAHTDFGKNCIAEISERTGLLFSEADDHFAAQSAMDTVLEVSGHIKTTASALIKIANDVRLLNSGPLTGMGEITLTALQPGSSIMPGKTNPVMCEALMMACIQVIGNDCVITTGNSLGNFQLNTMLPVLAYNILQSITILSNAARVFADKAVAGFMVNKERISERIEKNPVLVTALTPYVGYERASQIAKRAYAEDRRIREVAKEMTDLSDEQLHRLLDPQRITKGGILNT